jgi:archaemetzincin
MLSRNIERVRTAVPLLVVVLLAACVDRTSSPAASNTSLESRDPRVERLHSAMTKVEPFFQRMGKPQPSDWLTAFHEAGQTFDEYIASEPALPTDERRMIYVLPLGRFNAEQKAVIRITAGYLEAFFDLPVTIMDTRPIVAVYPNARYNSLMHVRQLQTGHILNDLLPPLMPPNGAVLIAFTEQDLYPDETMNYVFGQASVEKRVGVWSLYRLKEKAGADLFLHRTLKIAAHETGHMFSMKHCTKYECVMSGTNHLGETDRRPIDACPECMAKVCWFSNIDPGERYKRLADFCRKNGLAKDAAEFEKKAAAVSK